MKAVVFVTLKTGVLDPQGEASLQALQRLGYDSVASVRQGKYFEIDLGSLSKQQADQAVDEMCSKLLANTVIEDYRFELREG